MEAIQVSANQLYEMVGANAPEGMYRPASIGKMGKVRKVGESMTATLRNLNFFNTDELRAKTPENVFRATPSIKFDVLNDDGTVTVVEKELSNFRAIVGEESHMAYSVLSNLYKPVQHGEVIRTVADAIDELDMRVIGRATVEKGRMNAHAYLLGEQYSFDLIEDMKENANNESILGIRAINSHTGKTGFGLEFFSIRMVCSNYMAFGNILGKVYWNHKTEERTMINGYKSMLKDVVNGIPKVQKAMSDIDGTILNIDEATALLYGIGLQEANVEAIMDNMNVLNPEIENYNRPTVFDVYNTATAYISHKVTGGLESHLTYSDNVEKIVTKKTSELLNRGFNRMEVIKARNEAKLLKVNPMTTTVIDSF